jgi:hypothetical protein
MAVDQDPGTAWASGAEGDVQVELPLAPNTAVTQLDLNWNCKNIEGVGRLGPASGYLIRARDDISGLYHDVPFVRHGRSTSGVESVTFGTSQSTNPITTDRVVLLLTNRELSVDYYSLREVTLRNDWLPVAILLPTSSSSLGGPYSTLHAFDRDTATEWASNTQGMVGALNVAGSNLKFTSLKIIGFGSKANRECFPMAVVTSRFGPPAHLGNVLIEDCVLTAPATNSTSGVTALEMLGNNNITLSNAVVRRCTISGLRPHFATSQGIGASRVENCTVADCNTAVYFEPDAANVDSVGPILLRSNLFLNVDRGIYVETHPRSFSDSLTCLDNEIILTGRAGWGFAICDTCAAGPTGGTTNVTVLNNIIRYADWNPRPFNPDGGLYFSDIQHAVFGNNVVALGTSNSLRVRACPSGFIPPPDPVQDCDHFIVDPPVAPSYPPCLDTLPPGYQRAWFNNRNPSGALLEARFSNNGVDAPASQQQWPE